MWAYKPDATVLYAIWSGSCRLYEGEYRAVDDDADNWLERQSRLYKETYLLIEGLDDDSKYSKIRTDYEKCLIEALKNCDKAGVFGNRAQNGILLFAFYIDDYDGNGENSLLYRSAKALNNERHYQEIVKI